MAKISNTLSYPNQTPIEGGDYLIGTAANSTPIEKQTKTFTLSDIASFIIDEAFDGISYRLPIFTAPTAGVDSIKLVDSLFYQTTASLGGKPGEVLGTTVYLDNGSGVGSLIVAENVTIGKQTIANGLVNVNGGIYFASEVYDASNTVGTGEQVLVSQTDGTVEWQNYQGSGLEFQGAWDADLNSPDLFSVPLIPANTGKYWIVSVAGTTPLNTQGGGTITDWEVGDWAIISEDLNDNIFWDKIDNSSVLTGQGTPGNLAIWITDNELGDAPVKLGAGNVSLIFNNSSTADGDYSNALGDNSIANGTASIAIGTNAQTDGNNSISVGSGTTSFGNGSIAMGLNSTATGDASVAMGGNAQTTGNRSVAMGGNVFASGEYSISLGLNTIATAEAAVALGQGTQATALASTAMGKTTIARGDYSTAMGINSDASGSKSTAMGANTNASGDTSTAMGASTTASGLASVAMGKSTIASADSSTAMGTNTQATGAFSTAMGNTTEAIGGSSTAMGQNTEASGNGSTAMGANTTASGTYSTAINNTTTASGNSSFSSGLATVASGDSSASMGTQTIASGNSSLAMGTQTEASGVSSLAQGAASIASGLTASAFGQSATAAGDYSHAAGFQVSAQGDSSIALGRGTDATALNSVAIGQNTQASAINAVAIGTGNVSSGVQSFSYGNSQEASGQQAIAIGGNLNTASGQLSISIGAANDSGGNLSYIIGTGNNTVSNESTLIGISNTAFLTSQRSIAIGEGNALTGSFAYAFGSDLEVTDFRQTVLGSSNLVVGPGDVTQWVATDNLLTIGNGVSTAARSNALEIRKDGELKLNTYGSGNVTGTPTFTLSVDSAGRVIETTPGTVESAEKIIQTVRFAEAVSKGDPLVITGYNGANGPAIVEIADSIDNTKMPAYGVALEDYALNDTGLMIAVGDFDGIDTSAYAVGDTLYVGVGGGLTNVKPTGTALIQNMGIVSRSNAINGAAEIVAVGRANDVPNLPDGRLFVGTAGNTSLASTLLLVDEANSKLVVDGSAEFSGTNANPVIFNNDGTASNEVLNFKGSARFDDNAILRFGAGTGDMSIYHDAVVTGDSIISDVGPGNLQITGKQKIEFREQLEGDFYAVFNENGSSQLYHNNVKRIETTSTGIDVTGSQSVFSGQVTIPTTPIAATDAASKAYVDSQAVGAGMTGSGQVGELPFFNTTNSLTSSNQYTFNLNGSQILTPTIGIGLNGAANSKGAIEIASFIDYDGNPFDYFLYTGAGGPFQNFTGAGVFAISVHADGRFMGSGVHVYSDERIKKDISVSDSKKDLETISKIEISNYKYIDEAQGNREQKKVIAQQVMKHYPQAVSVSKDIVPDVYKKSTIEDGVISDEIDNCVVGDKVKLIYPDGHKETVNVIESNGKNIKVDSDKSGDVLVFGKEVDDYHSVDYDALAMLNISATQELHKIIKELKEEIQELKLSCK